jgi:hypothetical protein
VKEIGIKVEQRRALFKRQRRGMGKPVFFGLGPLEQWLAARERKEG